MSTELNFPTDGRNSFEELFEEGHSISIQAFLEAIELIANWCIKHRYNFSCRRGEPLINYFNHRESTNCEIKNDAGRIWIGQFNKIK